MLRRRQLLTILTSKSFSGAGAVQILATSTSKSAPNLSVFNDFNSQIVLARKFLTILTSKSLSRAGVVQILAHLQQPILRTRPILGADFPSQRSHKTMENTAFRALPTRQILMSHISAVSHLRGHIFWLTDLQQQLSV